MPTMILFIAMSLLLSMVLAAMLAPTRLQSTTAWLGSVAPGSIGVIWWALTELMRIRSMDSDWVVGLPGNTDAGTSSVSRLLWFALVWIGLIWVSNIVVIITVRMVLRAARVLLARLRERWTAASDEEQV